MTQIDDLAKDASYNGINLVKGDNLKVTFNESGKSKLDITGKNLDSAGPEASTSWPSTRTPISTARSRA